MKKTRLLALVHGEYSTHTVRVLEIAKAIRIQGNYEIIFSGNGQMMELPRKEGFDCVETKTLTKRWCNDSINNFIPRVYNKEKVECFFKEEESLLEKEKPDILLRDQFRELAGIAAKSRGIFDVFVMQANVSPFYHLDFRPINLPDFFKIFPKGSLRPFARGIESVVRRIASQPLYRKSKDLGLKITPGSMEGAEADLVLLPDSELLFPLSEIRQNYKFIGPLLAKDNFSEPDWLDHFKSDKRKKILISNGTTGEHEKTDLFAETFSDNTYAIALFANDRKKIQSFYGCEKFSLNSVLPFTDLFIMHGGLGSSYIGLKFGIPMIGLYNHFEQHINCMQLEKLKVAQSISSHELTPKSLRKMTELILRDKKYTCNAQEIAPKIDDGKALERAVKYIEEGYANFRNSK